MHEKLKVIYFEIYKFLINLLYFVNIQLIYAKMIKWKNKKSINTIGFLNHLLSYYN